MKLYKKIGLGISFAFLLIASFLLLPAHKTLAANPDFKLKFSDSHGSAITGTDAGGGEFEFDLNKLTASQNTWTYSLSLNKPGLICAGSELAVGNQFASKGAAATARVLILKYKTPTSGGKCVSYSGSTVPVAASSGGPAPQPSINWSNAKGVLSSDGSQLDVTYNDGNSATFEDNKVGDDIINFKPDPNSVGTLGGGSVASWCTNTVFNPHGGGDKTHGITLKSYSAKTGTVDICYDNGSGSPTNQNNITLNIDTSAYTPQADCNKTPNDPSCKVQTDNSCETSYTGAAKEFNWIFCSALRGIDSIINFFTGVIEGQLFLCTGTSDTTGQTCNGNILTNDAKNGGVYQVWSIFRIIATTLLVLVMLVMVLAQAFGGAGPLDAYTVRKTLPKLVVAAIFMQISWWVFKFAIDVSNDVGKGIADLMFYPFGGAGHFDLDNLIGGTSKFFPGVTIGAAAITTGCLIAFGGLTAIGWAFLGISMVASLFTGMLVLVLRRLLVIMCVILAPLALVAWILPGTKRYWDMWKDNFTKLLFMFPMIMAMIAGGRIFAYIGSKQGGFSGLIIVLVGVFGPYFYLPKTFKWGGQAFGALANATWSGTQKYRAAPAKYGLARAKMNREENALARAERLNEGTSAHPRFDRLLSGGYNYALSRETRRKHYQNTLEKGRKEAEESIARALIGSPYEGLSHQQKLQVLTDLAQGQADSRHGTGLNGADPAQQRWAMDELAKYGDWDIVSNLRDQGLVDQRTWEMFVAKNISAIGQKAAHLSPLKTDLSRVPSEEMTQWHSSEFGEFMEQYQQGYVRDAATGGIRRITDPDELREHRLRMIASANRTLSNPNIGDRIGQDQRNILQQVANGTVDSPTVYQTTAGGRSITLLPSGDNLRTAAQARASVTEVIGNETSLPAAQQSVTRQLAAKLADRSGSVAPADLAGTQDYVADLQSEATAMDPRTGRPASPRAKEIYNSLVTQYHAAVDSRLAQQQQELLHQGLTPADLARQTRNLQIAANRDKSMFNPVP